MTTIQPAYDAAAREAAHLMYRGSRTIDGQPRTWDTLHDTDKAACMAFAVPMVDAALAALDFREHTACHGCPEPDALGGEQS